MQAKGARVEGITDLAEAIRVAERLVQERRDRSLPAAVFGVRELGSGGRIVGYWVEELATISVSTREMQERGICLYLATAEAVLARPRNEK